MQHVRRKALCVAPFSSKLYIFSTLMLTALTNSKTFVLLILCVNLTNNFQHKNTYNSNKKINETKKLKNNP